MINCTMITLIFSNLDMNMWHLKQLLQKYYRILIWYLLVYIYIFLLAELLIIGLWYQPKVMFGFGFDSLFEY